MSYNVKLRGVIEMVTVDADDFHTTDRGDTVIFSKKVTPTNTQIVGYNYRNVALFRDVESVEPQQTE